MTPVNWQRVLFGGMLWAVCYSAIRAASWSTFLRNPFTAEVPTLTEPPNALVLASIFLITLAVGVVAIWLYAAIRSTYGPGASTATKAGLAVWLLAGALPGIIWGTSVIGLSVQLLLLDQLSLIVAVVLATLFGAWVYKPPNERVRL